MLGNLMCGWHWITKEVQCSHHSKLGSLWCRGLGVMGEEGMTALFFLEEPLAYGSSTA